jgi:DNA-binding XRE family transcriptional regulator
MLSARNNPALADKIGKASKVFKLLHTHVTVRLNDHALRAVVRVEERKKDGVYRRVVLVTGARIELMEVLRRQGPTVLSDANMDLHAPVLEKILSTPEKPFKPTVVRVEARDRVMVKRAIAPLRGLTRSGLLVGGRPVWPPIVDALRRTMRWVLSDKESRVLCLVTYRILAIAIRATLTPDSKKIEEEWLDAGLSLEDLAQARAALGPVLAAWKGEWIIGHYGGLRGMDHAMRADTFVTLAEPWPNVSEVVNEVAFCGLEMSAQARSLARAIAELEQAFGRARVPERLSPCRMLCVGTVLPGGSQWLSPEVDILEIPQGPIGINPDMSAGDLKEIRERLGMSQQQMAEKIGVSARTIARYEQGVCTIPRAAAISILSLLQEI